MHVLTAKILDKQERGSGVFLLSLEAPQIANEASAGQFVQVLVNETSTDPLLRRPFCIYNADKNSGSVSIIFEVVGRGTELLARKQTGDELNVIGPLGQGFIDPPVDKKVLIVGGGMGFAGLKYLCRELEESHTEYVLFSGTRDKNSYTAIGVGDLVPKKLNSEYFVSTDDGSYGHHGFITELVEKWLDDNPAVKPYIYACGPTPMLRAVQKLAKEKGLDGQMSLEARMACGFGVCLGCAVKKSDGLGYYKVCRDGPVFDLDKVNLDE